MGNFNDYIKNTSHEDSQKKDSVRPSDEKLEDMINKYQKFSDNELMDEFIKLTLQKKKKGELGKDEIINIKNTILPFLNNEQKKSLQKLLDMVENA